MKSLAAVLIGSIFIVFSGFAGLKPDINEEDFKQLRSTHFIIFYDRKVDEAYALKIKDTAERFYRIITGEFNLVRDTPWLWEKRTKIFIAKDKEDYLDKFGCSSWSAACVDYRDRIIYTYPDYRGFKPVFIHELTHIIFRESAGTKRLPLWLDEGMAVYVEDKYAGGFRRNSFSLLKTKIGDNAYIKLAELNAITPEDLESRSEEFVQLFYLESFSLVDFIINKYKRYNFSRFISCIQEGFSLNVALSKCFYTLGDLNGLEKAWKRFYQE